jgi:hypothetical protein
MTQIPELQRELLLAARRRRARPSFWTIVARRWLGRQPGSQLPPSRH